MGQSQPSDVIHLNLVVMAYSMPHIKIKDHLLTGFRDEDFKGYYHISAWLFTWSCAPTHLFQFSFTFSDTLLYDFFFI